MKPKQIKNVVFLGSKPIGYKCLAFLLNNSAELGCRIAGVLSKDNPRFGPEFSVNALAASHRVPVLESLDQLLAMEDLDFLISVQYHQILKPEHIAKASELAINLHMAPLPEYRGCNQFSFAIYNGSKIFGTTIHQLEPGIDSGKIIVESRFEMPENCLVDELYTLTFAASVALFEESIKDILSGSYQLRNQQDLVPERGTNIYFRKDIEKIKQIELTGDQGEISRRVRATSMPGFEPPFTIIDGEKFYIIPARQYNRP